MIDRSAVDTIRGYFYQFDLTILSILRLHGNQASIDVENIEDIDINHAEETTAIQCKYYNKTEYNHSLIAKPIRFMLADYKRRINENRQKIKYHIYGKYQSGQEKLILPFDIAFLKKHFLTFTHKNKQHNYHTEEDLTDAILEDFNSLLTVDINARTDEDQYSEILYELKTQFRCSDFDAEHYYYNNALFCIRTLTTNPDVGRRRVTKKTFLANIDKKQILFNNWFVELKGKKAFLRSIRKQYFTLSLNTSPFERFFLIDTSMPAYDRAILKTLLVFIQQKWSKLSRREPQSFCPYVYLHNIDEQELIQIKTDLHSEGYCCIDGFDFQGAEFSAKSLCRQATFGNAIRLKIINKMEHIDSLIAEIRKTKEIYQFYYAKPFYETHPKSIKHIKIQFNSLLDIQEVIK